MSGQLVMLPSSIRICIKSHELSPQPIHGDSISCRLKAMLERVLLIKRQYGDLETMPGAYIVGCSRDRSTPRISALGYLLYGQCQ